jgi:large subunit ribosomal protein L28
MARKCTISGKSFSRGHNVSHANNKTNKVSYPNLHWKRLYDSEAKKWVRVKVSSRALRTIGKNGLSQVLRNARLTTDDLS